MHVETKTLGTVIRDVLEQINYRKTDIQVIAAESVESFVAAGSGERGFVIIVNLDTGRYASTSGSWGGSNMFTRTIVDDANERIDIPPNGVVVKGTRGQKVWATLYVNPASMGNMLPSGEPADVLTDHEQQALYCFGSIKGGEYRREEMRRRNVSEKTVADLVARGYLKRNRAGATQITTKGKNARTGVRN